MVVLIHWVLRQFFSATKLKDIQRELFYTYDIIVTTPKILCALFLFTFTTSSKLWPDLTDEETDL